MAFNILYYPNMDIPDSSWLRKVVLYADSIGSIIPRFEDWKVEDSPLLRALSNEGQYQPFYPEWFFNSPGPSMREFESSVRERFEVNKDDWRLRRYQRGGARVSQVYASKFSQEIRRFFEEEHLINYDGNDWFAMNELAAATYLGVLAKFIGESHGYTPGTDSERFETIAFNTSDSGDVVHLANMKIFNGIPVPDSHVPIETILEFKRTHKSELKQFQRILLSYQRKIVDVYGNLAAINDVLQEFKLEWEVSLDNLQRELRNAQISFRWGSLKTLFAAAVVPGVAVLAFPHIPVLAAHAVLSESLTGLTSSALALRCFTINGKIEREKILNVSPFSYVFHANKQNLFPR